MTACCSNLDKAIKIARQVKTALKEAKSISEISEPGKVCTSVSVTNPKGKFRCNANKQSGHQFETNLETSLQKDYHLQTVSCTVDVNSVKLSVMVDTASDDK